MQSSLRFAALIVLGTTAVASQAVVVMDQIGSDPTNLTGDVFISQRFETGTSATPFSAAALDDFSVTASQLSLTQVQAFVIGFPGASSFQGFNNIQNWEVDIYNSVAAGASNLTGNVASQVVAPGGVTLNTGYASSIQNSALLTIPVSITLPSAGTYWVSVIGRMDSQFGQIGVGSSTSGTPGGNNGFIVNPGGGFGLTNNQQNEQVNFAYRVTAVPEPASMAALALGAAALLRRRRKA